MFRSSLLRVAPPAALLLVSPLLPGPARSAPGQLHLSWNSCSPVLNNIQAAPGQASGLRIVAYVTGQSDPTLSYEVWMYYGVLHTAAVPDAWRFDPAGCQGSTRVTIDYLPPGPLEATCPAFQNAGGGTPANFALTDVSFSPPTLPYPTTLMRTALADIYVGGNTPDPGTTYFLMGMNIDQSMGVSGPSDAVQGTCGGLDNENPICFVLMRGDYIINDGTMNQVDFHWVDFGLTANDPSNLGCVVADPAQPATWGSIKAQYRN